MGKKKDIVLGMLTWGWNEEFPIQELKEFLNKENVKDVHEIDGGWSDNVLILTSKRISKKKAYELYNQEMRERYGEDHVDIEYNKRD